MAQRRILWLDGDDLFAASYIEALEEFDLAVDHHPDVDLAMRDVLSVKLPFDLVIWELSLSPGKSFASKPTQGGMFTGRFFYERLISRHPRTKTLLFTNHRWAAAEWNAPRLRQYALAKRNVLPDEFAEAVKGILDVA